MDLPFRMVGISSFPSLLLLLVECGVLLGVLVASSSSFRSFHWMLDQLRERVLICVFFVVKIVIV